MNFENYEKFLGILGEDLDKIFEHQKEYIACKKGCSLCCEQGEYPFSELEFNYIIEGLKKLDKTTKQEILKNVEIIKQKNETMYQCPFLINKECSVYKYRGLICRTFGIMTQNSSGKITVPFCHKFGLNYSKVYDEKNKKITLELLNNASYKVAPRIFNLSQKNIMNLDLAKELKLEFGERKRLIDWFKKAVYINKAQFHLSEDCSSQSLA